MSALGHMLLALPTRLLRLPFLESTRPDVLEAPRAFKHATFSGLAQRCRKRCLSVGVKILAPAFAPIRELNAGTATLSWAVLIDIGVLDQAQALLAKFAGLAGKSEGVIVASWKWREAMKTVDTNEKRLKAARSYLRGASRGTPLYTFMNKPEGMTLVSEYPSRIRQEGNEAAHKTSVKRSSYQGSVERASEDREGLFALMDFICMQ
ncbi:hypothetical protein BOTBODRAFT_48392 [Botryobasidium botryosum FD-172 SS1]|uniref:Uncharacterized protein n=1 Tax=Botryobasidium botryosum (strain FD-172 SS1) TaxID=930990 RepID=A0A067M932_BOTB1|nr:hypothetical protein BOTBODRAFT_48392 [Botryobasidium botryosum FD-172 SS1]